MHDWALHAISVDWKSGSVMLSLTSAQGSASIVANDVRELRIPRAFPWGPS